MFCGNCGKEVNEAKKFCPYCGSSLTLKQNVNATENSGSKAESLYTSSANQPADTTPSNGMAAAALVLGIVGIIFAIIPFLPIRIIGLILGILGIVLSAVSKKQNGSSGMATGGLVLGILAVIFAGIMVAAWASCAATVGSCASALSQF